MRAIIIAAGEGTRWGNYLGVPKHFAPIDGEPIIKRTVRLLNERGVKDVFVVGPDESYRLKGSELFIPTRNPDNGDLDKFLNSSQLWDPRGKTIIFYGDVYFTEDAMNWILEDEREHFVLHARPFNSHLTGTEWGECFALSFGERHHRTMLETMVFVREAYQHKVFERMGGWEVYRASLRDIIPVESLKHHIVSQFNFNAINDWIDDFDYAEDYDRFVERRKKICVKS